MTLSSSKLIRQRLLFHYQSKTRLTTRHKIISILRRLSFSVVCSAVLFPASVVAQITPDNSVPTTVEQTEDNMQINGGEREGNNLFHSFDEFSIPSGMEAIFENATDIENIFTRVTGGEVSNIDGILSTQGDANFFFINPNGIVFGDNASLNVGGSFIASSADSIQFEDGSEFSATNPSEPILDLTGFPVGLGLGELPGAITVNGSGNQITPDYTSTPTTVEDSANSLSVQPGNTLALIGGDINTNGATINASDGRIDLASVNSGLVNFQPAENGFAFNFDDVANYQNITLDNQTVLNASGEGRGDISLDAANLDLSDGSLIIIQNQGDASSGTIDINATESLTLSGTSPDGNVSSVIRSEATNSGKAGDINISTQKLILQNGGRIGSTAYADALSGNVNINSSDSVQLLENTLVNQERQTYVVSGISTSTSGDGDAGNLQLTTSNFDITSGASVQSATSGTGNGGTVTINADSINISGINPNPERTTSSAITASTTDIGNAGNIFIEAEQLRLTDGGRISSSSFSTGNAGRITVNASDKIEVSGINGELSSAIRSVATSSSETSNLILGLPASSGNAGNVTINTPSLNVNSGGEVTVANEGSGNAGTLTINAEDINLDNTGSITAAAASGNGGNINLNTDDLQIDNESQITTEAGNNGDGGNITINTSNLTAKKNSNLTTSAEGGDGGNISITADTILGLENSDITANAVGGNGGNIDITTDLIYGYEARSQTTPFEDITASSELGIDGTVTINSPETSTEEDLILSAKKIELNKYKKLLTGSCLDENRPIREEFIYSGGGIPESPDNYLDDQEYFTSPNPTTLEELLQQRANGTPLTNNTTDNTPPIWQPGEPIVQANAVEIRNGRKFLVAVNKISEEGSSLCYPEVANASPTAKIQVKQIKFIGNYVFSDKHLKNIATIKEGSTVGIEDLFKITAKINNYYVNQGYISSGVFIASQEMTNGVIKVQVIEGTLTELEIKGLSHFQKSYFTKRLPMGEPLKQDKLLNILTKLNNNPLIADLKAKLIKITPETSRLILKVKEKNPLTTQFAVSNSFSPSVGTYGGEANFNYHFLGNGDIFNFGYSRTNKTGLVRYEAGYTFPINRYDGTINVSYTDAETNIVEEPTSALDIQADFKSYKFILRQPISINNISEQLFVELGLEQISSETFIDNDVSYPFTEGLPDGESKITALRLATEYINKGETSALLLRSQFNLGIDLLDATVSNEGIDGLFWSWLGKAQLLKKLNDDDWILASNLDIQLTPDKLLPIEQISVGGINSVRGYRQNLSIGDNGVIGSVELQIPLFEFLRFNDGVVKLHPFIDGGGVWNNQDENIEDSILLSFGLGVSLEIGKIVNARFDYGIPLIDADLPDDFDEGEKLTFSLVVTP
jgi:filamentous hemagglutinin family protein